MDCPTCKTEMKFTWSKLFPNEKMYMCFHCGKVMHLGSTELKKIEARIRRKQKRDYKEAVILFNQNERLAAIERYKAKERRLGRYVEE